MKLEVGLEAIERNHASVVTVGSFDGVHAGHQAILSYVKDRARARQACSTLLTFEPHPREVLTGTRMPLLNSVKEKAAILEAMGLSRLIIIDFSREFASMLPEDYVHRILVERIGLQEIVVGHDHGFGHARKGDVSLLRRMGTEMGFCVNVLPAEFVGSRLVSSRAIRKMIAAEGDVHTACALMTRPYVLHGRVVRGAGRGRTIGFSTANLQVEDVRKIVPRRGVYIVQAALQGETYRGMMNIGYRPTVESGTDIHMEVHLFDFDREIYDEVLSISFLHRLRDEVKFSSVAALKAQLSRDAAQSRAFFEAWEPDRDAVVPLA